MHNNIINTLTILAAKVEPVGDSEPELTDSVKTIIYGVITVLGLVAVVVIIVGGVSYMTSTGDPGKIKKAKDTILYGVIGLVVCVLSFAIVNFVLNSIGTNNS